MTRPVVLLLLALPALAAVACGPSFQAIYEGNSRFEHCYALEENPQAPMPEKADCWRDWSERYTYGQTRDRVQYAIARYVALSQAPNVPTDEALMMAAPGVTPRQQTITAPTPTSAFAPPPKVLSEGAAGAPPPSPTSELPQVLTPPANGGPARTSDLPASDCGDKCGASYRSCGGACAPDAGPKKDEACRAACERAYRACMRGCFK